MPRSFFNNELSFHPFFRFLDDFDKYTRDLPGVQDLEAFTPKFDMTEHKDSYSLHGELPGVEPKDIEIEFSDPQTMIVSGHSERSYTSGTPPAGLLEGTRNAGMITNGGDKGQQKESKKEQKEEGADKYWYSERTVGDFTRSFNFPTNVDQEKVKASMKNGILSIKVPKAEKAKGHKIAIEH